MYTGMRSLSKVFFIIIFLFGILFVSNGLSQEKFPNRPITMIGWSSAGPTFTFSTILCKFAEKEFGQPVIYEVKPGAAGGIATSYVAKSKPDGYTLGMNTTGTFTIVPQIRKVRYNPVTDIVDIIAVAKYNFGLAVRADAPWNNYEELIKYAKKNPGKFTYACAGVGVTQHIVMERIAKRLEIKWTHVPFKSGGESVAACLGGHTDAVAQGSPDIVPHIKAGKLKLLLVLDGKRWPDVPNVPQILEKGFDFSGWSYLSYYAPTGLPEFIRQKLHDVFKKGMEDPVFIKMADQYNFERVYMSGEEYGKQWRAQYEEMGKVIKGLGIAEE